MKSIELFLVKTSCTNYTKQKLKHKSSMANYQTNVKDILCTSYILFIIILSLVRVSKDFFPLLYTPFPLYLYQYYSFMHN